MDSHTPYQTMLERMKQQEREREAVEARKKHIQVCNVQVGMGMAADEWFQIELHRSISIQCEESVSRSVQNQNAQKNGWYSSCRCRGRAYCIAQSFGGRNSPIFQFVFCFVLSSSFFVDFLFLVFVWFSFVLYFSWVRDVSNALQGRDLLLLACFCFPSFFAAHRYNWFGWFICRSFVYYRQVILLRFLNQVDYLGRLPESSSMT